MYFCVCVFRRYYVVYKLVGFPPEQVYPPSSPLVCNCQCLTQLVTRPCLLPSAWLLDPRLLEVKLKNLSWPYTNMPPEYCCLFFVWALALQVCHVVCIFISTVLILFLPSCPNPFSDRSAPCLALPPTPRVHSRLQLVSLASSSTSPSVPQSAR